MESTNAKIDGVEERLQIIVLHRGFIYIGWVSRSETECVIRDARAIRRWGTTAGLGQLAKDGPQDNTKLDLAGIVRYHPLSEIHAIDCDGAKWA